MVRESGILPGTILWIAPFYNRSGYGVGARTAVLSLHKAGVRIRILSVNEIEPGIDDCDLALLKSLEATPLVPPITAIVSHVPSKAWLGINLPEPNLRIIATTFDSSAYGNLPPTEWFEVFEKMDQIWFQTYREREVFISAGIPSEKIQIVHFPHPWIDNSNIPIARKESIEHGKPFRFLSIAMFQPRRRWDVLIEAYLEEFKTGENVELYLKVNYPSWHPIPGRPQKDLHKLIDSLRSMTKSNAPIIIDEELGTRRGILEIIDSCNTYVSTDTSPTAPVAEARVRQRMVIVPHGIDYIADNRIQLEIAVDPEARFRLTQDMLLYQPHHKDAFMPQLHVKDVRHALRSAFNMSLEERNAICHASITHVPSPKDTIPKIIGAIKAGWKYKKLQQNKNTNIFWEGSQFVYHSLALINRELCMQLLDSGYEISVIPYEPDQFSAEVDPHLKPLEACINKPLTGKIDIHVRHQWPPNLTPPPEGHWIIIQPWEFGSLPKEWVRVFSTQVDEMWVPSNYVRQIYIDSGIPAERVVVIPNGINPNKFHPEASPYQLETQKKFKFLFVGATIHRKGIDILLQTYLNTFKRSDDVCLVIKDMGENSFYAGQTFKEKIERVRQNNDLPEIEYIDQSISEDELIGLYTACNILTHPYRGEGFGLPILEAMACGTPAIVTNGGASLDFCNNKNSLLVNASKILFEEKIIEDKKTVDYPWLFEVDVEDLKRKMRYAYENPEKMRILGKEISSDVRNNWTWERSAQKIKDRIEYLKNKPILRCTRENNLHSTIKLSTHDEPLIKAEELFRTGEYEEDIEIYKKAIEHNSDSFDTYYNLAIAHVNTGQIDKAISTFKKAIELNNQEASVFNNLGVLYFKKKEFNEARSCFENALEIDSDYQEAKQNLDKILKALKKQPIQDKPEPGK